MRRRAVRGGVSVANDRDLLIRFVEHLEATPRPVGWIARLRRARAIRRAHAMLDWEDARQAGPTCLDSLRNAQALGWVLMWGACVVTTLVRSHHPLTVARVALILGTLAVPFGVGAWFLLVLFPKRLWQDSERQYALSLEQARALPARAGHPDP